MNNIRKVFFNNLIDKLDDTTYFLTADLGFGVLDDIREKLGHRFINVGVAEQCMISVAAGLALSGKKVFTYTITTFYLRAIEQIKLDLVKQNLLDRVKLIGSGSYQSPYKNFGPSHILGVEDLNILGSYLKCLEIVGDGKLDMDEILKANLIVLPK
jgi:transketolase